MAQQELSPGLQRIYVAGVQYGFQLTDAQAPLPTRREMQAHFQQAAQRFGDDEACQDAFVRGCLQGYDEFVARKGLQN